MKELIVTLFQARTLFHILHLKSRSYAEHVALGELYEGLNTHIDVLVEQYQGRNKKLLDLDMIPNTPVDDSTALEQLNAFSDKIDECRSNMENENTVTQSLIDDLCTLIDSTAYKLRFLS